MPIPRLIAMNLCAILLLGPYREASGVPPQAHDALATRCTPMLSVQKLRNLKPKEEPGVQCTPPPKKNIYII